MGKIFDARFMLDILPAIAGGVPNTLLIAVVAFPLAYLSSKQVAGTLGTLFGKAAENVIVTPEHFMLVAIVGGILLVAAVLVSSISTLRLKPKQILAQME